MPRGWFDKDIKQKEAEINKMEDSESKLSRTESSTFDSKTQSQTTFGNIF